MLGNTLVLVSLLVTADVLAIGENAVSVNGASPRLILMSVVVRLTTTSGRLPF